MDKYAAYLILVTLIIGVFVHNEVKLYREGRDVYPWAKKVDFVLRSLGI